jgi:hypothetical protein
MPAAQDRLEAYPPGFADSLLGKQAWTLFGVAFNL